MAWPQFSKKYSVLHQYAEVEKIPPEYAKEILLVITMGFQTWVMTKRFITPQSKKAFKQLKLMSKISKSKVEWLRIISLELQETKLFVSAESNKMVSVIKLPQPVITMQTSMDYSIKIHKANFY